MRAVPQPRQLRPPGLGRRARLQRLRRALGPRPLPHGDRARPRPRREPLRHLRRLPLAGRRRGGDHRDQVLATPRRGRRALPGRRPRARRPHLCPHCAEGRGTGPPREAPPREAPPREGRRLAASHRLRRRAVAAPPPQRLHRPLPVARAPTPRPRSRKRCAPSTTSSGTARCATSAARTSRPGVSWMPLASRAPPASRPSFPRRPTTTCSTAASRPNSSPPATHRA